MLELMLHSLPEALYFNIFYYIVLYEFFNVRYIFKAMIMASSQVVGLGGSENHISQKRIEKQR